MDINIEKITQEFNQKLQELNQSSLAVSAYMGLLQYRSDYLDAAKHDEDGSLRRSIQESYFQKYKAFFPEKEINSIEEAILIAEEIARPALELNEQFKSEIKSYMINSGLELSAVRVLSPEQIGNVIPCSKGLLSQFREEQGDWVFASSTPKEENAYLARCQGKGMLGMGNRMYYYPDSSMQIKDGKIFIEPKGYIYYMAPDDFTPVTTVKRDKSGTPHFLFGDEWTCPHDISLETDVKRVEEYSDVTFLLEKLQMFSSSDMGITRALFASKGPERMKILKETIAEGKVQYLNGILNINTLDEFVNLKKASREDNTNEIRREENGNDK